MKAEWGDAAIPVPVLEGWDGSGAEFFQGPGRGPCVFQGMAEDAAAIDWTPVIERLAGIYVPLKTHERVGSSIVSFHGRAKLGDFFSTLETQEKVAANEWYLFVHFPEILEQLLEGIPDFLVEDALDTLPARWRFMRAIARTNVYCGGKGAATPFHADNLHAGTTVLQLQGTKHWLLMPPRYGAAIAGLPARIIHTPAELAEWLQPAPSEIYFVALEPGDLLYVPPGWVHQVENSSAAFAISRYFVHASNVEKALEFPYLGSDLRAALRWLLTTPRGARVLASPIFRRLTGGESSSRLTRALLRRLVASNFPSGWLEAEEDVALPLKAGAFFDPRR